MNRLLFLLFPFVLFSCSSNKEKIAIQPYGDVPKAILDSISKILIKTYESQVVVLEKKDLPNTAFVNIKSPRYRADKLLVDLLEDKPDSIDYIIGVTTKDISTSKKDAFGNVKQPASKYYDWGIFGLGSRPGSSCIISTYRLRIASKKLFNNRVQKIAVHEIGHNMGLKHCPSKDCVMQDAVETISTVDAAKKELCQKCRHKL